MINIAVKKFHIFMVTLLLLSIYDLAYQRGKNPNEGIAKILTSKLHLSRLDFPNDFFCDIINRPSCLLYCKRNLYWRYVLKGVDRVEKNEIVWALTFYISYLADLFLFFCLLHHIVGNVSRTANARIYGHARVPKKHVPKEPGWMVLKLSRVIARFLPINTARENHMVYVPESAETDSTSAMENVSDTLLDNASMTLLETVSNRSMARLSSTSGLDNNVLRVSVDYDQEDIFGFTPLCQRFWDLRRQIAEAEMTLMNEKIVEALKRPTGYNLYLLGDLHKQRGKQLEYRNYCARKAQEPAFMDDNISNTVTLNVQVEYLMDVLHDLKGQADRSVITPDWLKDFSVSESQRRLKQEIDTFDEAYRKRRYPSSRSKGPSKK